jgi:hypothetical protein
VSVTNKTHTALCMCDSLQVYEIARKSGAAVLLQEGHHSGELWGLSTHPTDPDVYATAGDGTLRHVSSCSTVVCALQCAAGVL